jgi:SAM-dependent methyltransferase
MYSDLAWTFPIVGLPEEYDEEAENFRRAILEHARIPAHGLLDLGCGSGHLDVVLKKIFQVTGVDLSPEMLLLARRQYPQVTYLPGDMRNLGQGTPPGWRGVLYLCRIHPRVVRAEPDPQLHLPVLIGVKT